MPKNMPAAFREYMTLERRRASEDGMTVADLQRWTQLKRVLNKHFQPGVQDTHSDRRDSIRVPARLRVGFKSYGEIRESLMTNMSRGGLFISTPEPLPLGTRLRVQLRIEESNDVIDLPAVVASRNSGPGLMSEELGMGVKFVQLSPDEEKALDNLYERALRRAIER
jgi:type IV pilus assembly protein PilZ